MKTPARSTACWLHQQWTQQGAPRPKGVWQADVSNSLAQTPCTAFGQVTVARPAHTWPCRASFRARACVRWLAASAFSASTARRRACRRLTSDRASRASCKRRQRWVASQCLSRVLLTCVAYDTTQQPCLGTKAEGSAGASSSCIRLGAHCCPPAARRPAPCVRGAGPAAGSRAAAGRRGGRHQTAAGPATPARSTSFQGDSGSGEPLRHCNCNPAAQCKVRQCRPD